MAKKPRKKVTKRFVSRTKKKAVKKRQIPKPRKLNQKEQNVLWCLHLGTNSAGRISQAINLRHSEVKDILKLLETRGLARHRSVLGQYKLTESGLRHLGTQQLILEAGLGHVHVKNGQETELSVLAKNSGGVPLNKAMLKVVAPKFVEITRYGSDYKMEGDKRVVEFPLSKLYPKETQNILFKTKGVLTGGAISSNYKIEINALVSDKVTDKKELSLIVQQ